MSGTVSNICSQSDSYSSGKNPGSGNDPSYHSDSGDQTVHKKTARTGDSTQILPVLILLAAASAALVILGIIYKRRKKSHKDK